MAITNEMHLDFSFTGLCVSCTKLGYCRLNISKYIHESEWQEMLTPNNYAEAAKLIPIKADGTLYGPYSRKHLQLAFDAFHQDDFETAYLHFATVAQETAHGGIAHMGMGLCTFQLQRATVAHEKAHDENIVASIPPQPLEYYAEAANRVNVTTKGRKLKRFAERKNSVVMS